MRTALTATILLSLLISEAPAQNPTSQRIFDVFGQMMQGVKTSTEQREQACLEALKGERTRVEAANQTELRNPCVRSRPGE